MASFDPSTHPRENFLFFLDEDASDDVVEGMRSLVEHLAEANSEWTIAPPRFVDQVDPPEDPTVDFPVRTVGGVLELFSAQAAELPRELDRAALAEVETVIEELERLSGALGMPVALELAGTQVGWIENGKRDRLLEEGLLVPWRSLHAAESAGDP